MEQIPQDPYVLMSFINMKLRDEFPSLDELCATLGISKQWLIDRLAMIGMEYSKENNRFW